MKHFLKIKSSNWVTGSTKEMIYEDEDGKLYIGPPFNHMIGETLVVEASDGPIEGYYRIIKLIDKIPTLKE